MDAALTLAYLMFLAIALLAPFVKNATPSSTDGTSLLMKAVVCSSIVGALLLFVLRGELIFPLAPLLLIPLLRHGGWTIAGGAVALSLFAPAIWWSVDPLSLPIWQWFAFAGLAAAAIMTVRHSILSFGPITPIQLASRSEYQLGFAVAVLIALGLGAYSAPFNVDLTGHTAWHHWGAYLSPVESLLAGGVPYREFPIQYGIGPTLLIAAFCGADCWNGMFYVATAANAIYCAVLAVCALLVTAEQRRGIRILSAVAIGCAALLWTGFPSDFGTALGTPSVAGLRFLPLVLQLLFILANERSPQRSMALGHAIWVFNLFWSIEAAVFASLLWWPWLAFRAVRQSDDPKNFSIVLRYAATGAGALAAAMLMLLAAFWSVFGQLPELSTVVAYFQNPPGRWPANPFGPVWLIVVLALMGLATLTQRNLNDKGILFACLIAMLAVFSYYLSRSHDNNVLNLFPFILLVALCLLSPGNKTSRPGVTFPHGFALMLLISTIAFVATFNFTVWTKIAGTSGITDAGPGVLKRQTLMPLSDPDPIVSADAVALVAQARRQSHHAILLFDSKAIMPWAAAGSAWTGVNNVANFSPLPAALVQRYISRGAVRYRRAGWLVVNEETHGDWPRLFANSYDVRLKYKRGRYDAYLMTPKSPTIPQRSRDGVYR